VQRRRSSVGGAAFVGTGLLVVGCSLVGIQQAQRLGDETAVSVTLTSAMVVAAAVAAVTLAELAATFENDALAWMAWGFGVAAGALALISLTFPAYAEGGGLLGSSRAAHGLVAVGARTVLPLFALLAVLVPHATGVRRALGAGFTAAFLLVILVVPSGDLLVDADGDFSVLARVLLGLPVLLFAAATVAWAVRRPPVIRPVAWWIGIGLLVGLWASVEWVFVDGDLTAAWWGAQLATAAVVVVPAAGMLAAVLSMSRSARVGERQLRRKLDTETAPGVDPAARGRQDRPVVAAADVDRVFDTDTPWLAYQPIVDLSNGDTYAVEALSRFDLPPDRPPDEWFDEAHRCGRGVELEMRSILRAMADLDALPQHVALAVNASPVTLADRRFTAALEAVDVRRLIVEITEREAVDDYIVLKSAVDDLRERGMRISIDDAGAGHAGLRHLVGIVPDIIKLDISLTHRTDDAVVLALVRALTAFARSVGAVVVGEGVETDEQRRRLIEAGVELGQGFRLGRPQRVSDLSHVMGPT